LVLKKQLLEKRIRINSTHNFVRLIIFNKKNDGTTFDYSVPNRSEKVAELLNLAETKGLMVPRKKERNWW